MNVNDYLNCVSARPPAVAHPLRCVESAYRENWFHFGSQNRRIDELFVGIKRMNIKFLLVCTVCTAVIGCSSTKQNRVEYPEFRSLTDGKIQIATYGDVESPGVHWVDAPANLSMATEIVGGWTTEQRPLYAFVRRPTTGGNLEHVAYLLPKMTESEKKEVLLEHGTIIWYGDTMSALPSRWYKSRQIE